MLRSVLALSLISFSCFLEVNGEKADGRPNIIVVMTDDQGYGDLSCHGHPFIKTPHIDKLREQSMRFENFNVSSSCAPSRAGIMSGVHPFTVGVTHTIFHRDLMALDRKTIAEVMREAGYSTGIFGKWHLGDADPYQPQNRGFEESLIHGGGIAGASGIRTNGSYYDMLIRHNGDFVQTRGFCTDVFFGRAIQWMKQEQEAEKPFFACIFPNAPHGPWSAPEKYAKMYDDIKDDPKAKGKAGFFAMISNIDDNMGWLMKELDDSGLAEDTILIFMTDNGSVASSVYNAGMRGGKTSVNEGGSRVPFFIRWPETVEAGREVNHLARHFDLLPTFAELAGADVSELSLDGKSLVPLLKDPDSAWEERTFFYHKGRWGNPASKHEKHRKNPGADNNKFRTFAVRDAQWRLTVSQDVDRGVMLCDMQKDPGEKTDVSKQHPEVVSQMLKVYGEWWDVCRPLMINEDADITKGGSYWRGYLKEQEAAGAIPELIIPGVATDLKVISMSSKKSTD